MIFFWEGAGAVDNAPARRKGALGKHHETQISPPWSLCNFLDFPSHFGMKYDRPWNMGQKLLDKLLDFSLSLSLSFSLSLSPSLPLHRLQIDVCPNWLRVPIDISALMMSYLSTSSSTKL